MEDKKSPKLYLNMILADYEPVEMVERSINSVKDFVDDIYITVTYKKEEPKTNTKLIKKLIDLKANISFFKWVKDFSAARQYALSKVPTGNDCYVYWHDVDDVLRDSHKLPQVLREMHKRQVSAWFFPYLYQVTLDDKGNIHEVLVEHKRERIIINNGSFKWVGTLHETLIEQVQENIIKYGSEDCAVVHLSDSSRADKNLERNIEILEETVEKEKYKDPRTTVYLAKAYFDKAKVNVKKPDFKLWSDKALKLFYIYLNGSGIPGTPDYCEPSGWKEERSTIWSYIAELAILSNNLEVALNGYQEAINECPFFPNYYIDKSMVYVMLGEYKEAKHYLKLATSMDMPHTTIITTPRDIKTRALEVAFQIAMHEQKLEDALSYMEELKIILPGNKDIEDRILTVNSLNQFNKACQSVVFLGKYLEQIGEKEKITYLVKSLSSDMQKEKFAAEMRHKFLPKKIWGEKEIAIICGPGFEEWNPNSIKTGLGGSEEAVVHLSNELTSLGWKVTVYANPGKEAGNFNGVEYRPYYDLNPLDSFNVLIMWRSIGFVDINPDAKFKIVWLHDVPNNPDFTEERVNKVDKIAVLSEYHESLLRMSKNGEFVPVPKNKIMLTANGIQDLSMLNWDGNEKRLIYASSPDRGLIYLLKNWNKIIEKVPDAELNIYYGFDVFDAIHKNNPAKLLWKQQIIEMMRQPGIKYHGRIGHDDLHKEYSKSGIWAYPTNFEEISCISAMKAQALGAIPVVTNYAALQETVKNGIRVDVDINTEEGQQDYIDALIEILSDKKSQDSMRAPMMKFARANFGWKRVASQWDKEINNGLKHPENKFLIN